MGIILWRGFDCRADEASGENPLRGHSFLIEEAYNVDSGILRHSTSLSYDTDLNWFFTFQETAGLSSEHQLSLTLPVAHWQTFTESATGLYDTSIDYRYQAAAGDGIYVAPRFSLILPTGKTDKYLGQGGAGVELGLPFSFELSSSFTIDVNAGWALNLSTTDPSMNKAAYMRLFYGGGLVWATTKSINFLFEALSQQSTWIYQDGSKAVSRQETLSLGTRGSVLAKGSFLLVAGLALPITITPETTYGGWTAYLSAQHQAW